VTIIARQDIAIDDRDVWNEVDRAGREEVATGTDEGD
jgi:hypothetical protein